jgi:transcriptional regulator with XRE-family HTH domain
MLDEQILHALGSRIRDLRLQQGLSQERLAELSGIHENHLRRIELGQVNPTVLVLFHISDALQVSVDDIISAVRLRPKQSR